MENCYTDNSQFVKVPYMLLKSLVTRFILEDTVAIVN